MADDETAGGGLRDGPWGDGAGNPVSVGEPRTAPKGHRHPDGRVRGSAEPVPGRCGRRLRNPDPPRYCAQWPLRGRDACRFCGGKSPAAAAHYQFRTGRYSRYLPRGLAAACRRAASDRELLSLRDDLALIVAFQVEQLKALGEATPPAWAEALKLAERLAKGIAKRSELASEDRGGAAEVQSTLQTLLALLREGKDRVKAYEKARSNLLDLIDRKVRTTKAEHRRLQDLACSLTVEQALAFGKAVLDAVERHVSDRNERAKVGEAVQLLLNAREKQPTRVINAKVEGERS
jgi:hypothetical protein